MHGISIVVSKRVQVGVGRGICSIVSSDSREETQRYPLGPTGQLPLCPIPDTIGTGAGKNVQVSVLRGATDSGCWPVSTWFEISSGLFKQFANSGRSCWHSMLKSEVVNYRQFLRRKHDMPLTAEIVHGAPPKKEHSQALK
jgi:hypothetical protein